MAVFAHLMSSIHLSHALAPVLPALTEQTQGTVEIRLTRIQREGPILVQNVLFFGT